MFVYDFLSRFSSNSIDEEQIPYLTDTTLLDDASYMSHLEDMCQFNYDTLQRVCTSHSFPLMRSQAKRQKIAIPSLFKTDQATSGPNPKASVLRDPPAIMASKRSTALAPIDLNQTTHKKRGHGCPPLNRTVQPTPPIADIDDNIVEDMNETLPTLFPVRRRRQQAVPVAPLPTVQPDAQLPYNDDEMALKQIHIHNLQDNIDLTCRTAPVRPPTHNYIPQVIEDLQPIDMDRHFPRLYLLNSTFSKDLQLQSCRDIPHQNVINKIVEQLNSKTMHFYNLPFALDTLINGQYPLTKNNTDIPFNQKHTL